MISTQRAARDADAHDVDDGAPARVCVTVDGVEQCLRDSLEQLLRLLYRQDASAARNDGMGTYEVGFPKALSHAEELAARGAADDKVLCEVEAADEVGCGDERLRAARGGCQACDDGLDEVRAKAVQASRRE